MPPMVTIITVTYNRAHILPASVDSVLSQDYPHLRLMIVDDGSTDGTAAILEQYEKDLRVEVLRHETNQGVTAARNTALDHLGDDVEYFGYNDSDDMLVPGAIEHGGWRHRSARVVLLHGLRGRHGRGGSRAAGLSSGA